MSASGPFREDDSQARYFCLVCYKAASAAAAKCPVCGTPLQTFSDPLEMAAWIEQLRERARRKKARPRKLLYGTSLFAAGITSVILFVLLVVMSDGTSWELFSAKCHGRGCGNALGVIPLMWLVLAVPWLYLLTWAGAFRDSRAIADRFDPNKADVNQLLAWLGVQLIDADARAGNSGIEPT